MIWFNIKELERKIIENEFSDEDGFKYFLASSIVGVLASSSSSSENFITFITMMIGLGVTIWGSYSIFKANSSGDGQDFFKRYFALSWVISFRLFIFILMLAIPSAIIFYFTSPDSFAAMELNYGTLKEDFIKMIIGAFILLIYYFLLMNSFKRVSLKSES